MFHPNQLVCCVDDGPCNCGCRSASGLKHGAIYTVRDAGRANFNTGDSQPAVRLYEVRRTLRLAHLGHDSADAWFGAVRFRPVNEKSIEVFRSMLISPPVSDAERQYEKAMREIEEVIRG